MKKILCVIEKQDILELIELVSDLQTFMTLSTIFNEKERADEVLKLSNRIQEISQMIVNYKNDLLKKYDVPYYVSNPMKIDIYQSTIYVDL